MNRRQRSKKAIPQQNTSSKIAAQAEKNTEKKELWLTIINIIITMIIGSGTLLETLYINSQNEQTQVKIIQLQSDIQRNNNYAHLKIADNGKSVTIGNLGPASANNVKIIASLNYINPLWKEHIYDTSQFRVETFQPQFIDSVEYFKSNTYSSIGLLGNDSIKITIKSLPPNEAFYFSIEPLYLLQTKQYVISRKTNLYLFSPNKPLSNEAINEVSDSFLDDYLNQKLMASLFYIFTSCDNCEKDDNTLHYLASSLNAISEEHRDERKIDKNKGYYLLSSSYDIVIQAPQELQQVQMPSPLLLKAYYADISQQRKLNSVLECTLLQCTQSS